MRMNRPIDRIRTRVLDERGVTMIIALGVMLVTSLLLVGAFTSANGDVHNARINTVQKQAYYAALAGIQEYEYQLQANPDYWQECEESASTVPTEAGERYEIKLLAASSEPEGTKCSTSAPFATMIESKVHSLTPSGSSQSAVPAQLGSPAAKGKNARPSPRASSSPLSRLPASSTSSTSRTRNGGPWAVHHQLERMRREILRRMGRQRLELLPLDQIHDRGQRRRPDAH